MWTKCCVTFHPSKRGSCSAVVNESCRRCKDRQALVSTPNTSDVCNEGVATPAISSQITRREL